MPSQNKFAVILISVGVNIMACVDQHQFCNPNNDQCTNFTSSTAAFELAESIGMNFVQRFNMFRFGHQLMYSSLHSSLAGRGGSALRAQELVENLQSQPLPNNQWMIEVQSWFNAGLARLQRNMVEYAAGPPDMIDNGSLLKFNHPLEDIMCHNQMVHSTSETTNFSMLGLALVLIIGSIVIMTNLLLDTIVGFIQRRFKTGDHRRLQWIVDEQLQLQRMAYEEAGMGTWSGGAAPVPITRFGEKFGIPPDTDPDHPRLRDRMEVTGSGEETESARLMRDKTNSTETTYQL